ncbi:MAG: chromosome segregation protein SMC, partial [Gammaproteobacteria bacterium]|nr:chromosome segregation protein SMC [Gammaproteobacteria bacterium]
SHYYLNGTRCRRRDITGLFLGTGLGPRGYSIIEQGMISRLIEAKPEELRVFLEEAAGISKYKERRRETETRIRHTRENLDRLNDLREEIDSQLEKLQRQAKAAEKYKILKHDERQLKAELLVLRLRKLDQDVIDQERIISKHETDMEAAIAGQRSVESALEKDRESLTEANDAFNEVQGRYYALGGDIARVEQAIQHSRDMRQKQTQDQEEVERNWQEIQQHIELDESTLVELEQGLKEAEPALDKIGALEQEAQEVFTSAEQHMQEWQQGWDTFTERSAENSEATQIENTRIDHLERQIIQYEGRLKRMEEEKKSLDDQGLKDEIATLEIDEQKKLLEYTELQHKLDSIHNQISGLREQNQQVSTELDDSRNNLQDKRGKLVSLEALQQAALGKSEDSVTDWLEGRGLKEAPRLAKELEVDKGWERAVETVLGFHLEAVCMEGMDGISSVLHSLKHGALTVFDTKFTSQEVGDHAKGVPLQKYVRAPWSMDSLLSGVYCADNLVQALEMRGSLTSNESVVTPDGIWVGNGWLRVAKDADEKAGVLDREKEIKALTKQVDSLTVLVEGLEQKLADGNEQLETLEHDRDHTQQQVNETHRLHSDLKSQLTSRQSRLEQVHSRAEKLQTETDELNELFEREGGELKESRVRLNQALAAADILMQEREKLTGQREQLSEKLGQAREAVRAIREDRHQIALKTESMRSQLDSIRQNLGRMEKQLGGLKLRREELQHTLESSVEPLREKESELEKLLEGRMKLEAELTEARHKLEQIDEAVRQHEQDRTGAEQKVQQVREHLEKARMNWQGFDVRRNTVQEQLDETDFEKAVLLESLDEDATEEQWHEKVEKMGNRIQRLGSINLAAIDEFTEQSERKKYLDEQYDDVTEALATLENAIRKIDKETRARFKETYDKVNSGLQEMFPRMFGGGQAYLELTGDDLLDAGVSVMAQPPGKRNSSIHLLSGGEKALTAVSLIFSIFQLNPSPFCMLDEVDAPLDDANVGRFCELV